MTYKFILTDKFKNILDKLKDGTEDEKKFGLEITMINKYLEFSQNNEIFSKDKFIDKIKISDKETIIIKIVQYNSKDFNKIYKKYNNKVKMFRIKIGNTRKREYFVSVEEEKTTKYIVPYTVVLNKTNEWYIKNIVKPFNKIINSSINIVYSWINNLNKSKY